MGDELTAKDIVVDGTYVAKRRTELFGKSNDRYVLYINEMRTNVQYDSDTVKDGRHYPTVSMEAFLKWAKAKAPAKPAENGG